MGLTLDYKEFAPLPTGEYPATIDQAEAADGQFGPQIQWVLDIGEVEDSEGNVENRTLFVWTPQTITPRNRLGKLVVAAGLELGADLDTDELIGRRVLLTVVREPATNDKPSRNTVAGFDRLKARASAKPAKAAAPVPDGGDPLEGWDEVEDDD